MTPSLPDDLQLESLEVGAAPLVQQFLQRLQLASLFEKHLPVRPGRSPALPSSTLLCLIVTNLLLNRQPLYAIPQWANRRVAPFLGLQPDDLHLLNDDCFGRALDHLHQADTASLLTALVIHLVGEFDIDLSQFHQDTTTATFFGEYDNQPADDQVGRPPKITFGYNKDHRPDLKQLLYSITISDDGAVPVHCKLYDGNTTDDAVHIDTWSFLRQLAGHSDFLYVADSKLCSRKNMEYIATRQGRFLTVMPRTRGEDNSFREYAQDNELDWQEVHREPHPRRQDGPDVVYDGVESPQRSSEGYRLLWYRSSQKAEQDRSNRQTRLERARAEVAGLRKGGFTTREQAQLAGQRIVQEGQVQDWLHVKIDKEIQERYRQKGPGRPGPATEYRREEQCSYHVELEEDGPALAREALCDGLFPLMSNDETLSLREALRKYKYQPFVEKRHQELKSVFGVMPMWLKSVSRVSSLLWLYHVVEMVAALVEREVRRRMEQTGQKSLALYPEGRECHAPTSGLVLRVLEGHRRHRLLDGEGQEMRCFHDEVPEAAQEVIGLLGVDGTAYGLD